MDTRRLIVELISKNDGRWTWYQLERGLNRHGLGGHVNAVTEAETLINDGLLACKVDPAYSAPLYFITSKGKLMLQIH